MRLYHIGLLLAACAALSCSSGSSEAGGVCAQVTCGGHGTCSDVEGRAACACEAGFHAKGLRCIEDETCGGVDCSGHGTCAVVDGASICTCDYGYKAGVKTCSEDPTLAKYALEVPEGPVNADGLTSFPVTVVVTEPESGVITPVNVMFVLSSSAAGLIAPDTLEVGESGGLTGFIPCNGSVDPSCLGTVQISMVLAGDATQILARSRPLELVSPRGVGYAEPCLKGGNILSLFGDPTEFIYKGLRDFTGGTWTVQTKPQDDPALQTISIRADAPAGTPSGDDWWWMADFSTEKLGGVLATRTYTDGQRYPFMDEGHPGLAIGGWGRGCNELCGSFQVHELTMEGIVLKKFTASFSQYCECGTRLLRGCVHFEQ